MAIVYGSNIPLAPLPVGSVAVFKAPEKKDSNSWWSFIVNLALTAAEVAIAFIPGVGVAITIPLGVAFAAARAEATSAITGKGVDWTSFGIDAATPFLSAGLGSVVKNIRAISEARGILETAGVVSGKLIKEGGEIVVAAENSIKGVTALADEIGLGNREIAELAAHEIFGAGGQGIKQAGTQLGELATGKVSIFSASKSLAEIKTSINSILESTVGNFEKLATKFNAFAEGGVFKDLSQVTALFKGVLGKSVNEVLTRGLERATEEGIETLARNLNTSKTVINEANTLLLGLTKAGASLGEATEVISKFLISKGVNLSIEQVEEVIKQLLIFEESFKSIKGLFGLKASIIARASKVEKGKILELSHDGIKNVFQPGDFVGDYVRKQFSKLSKVLEKNIKTWAKKIGVAIKKGWKAEQMFERTGGIILSSSVILGIKVIKTPGTTDLVQIVFRSDATGGNIKDPKALNYGGKKPVWKKMTRVEIARLVTGGMGYYLKRFANSKGGRHAAGEFFDALPALSAFASAFLPIGDLTKIVSMISMIKRGVKNYQKHGGSNIWEEFTNDVKGKSISGGSKLLGRSFGAALGGGILGKLVGKSIATYLRPIMREGKPDNLSDFFKKEIKQVARHATNHAAKRSYNYKNFRKVKTTMRASKRLRGLFK